MARGTRHEHTWVARHANARTPGTRDRARAHALTHLDALRKEQLGDRLCSEAAREPHDVRAWRAARQQCSRPAAHARGGPRRVDQRHGNAVCCLRPRKRHGAHAALEAPARRHAHEGERDEHASGRRRALGPHARVDAERCAQQHPERLAERLQHRAERRDAHREHHAATTACTREERRRGRAHARGGGGRRGHAQPRSGCDARRHVQLQGSRARGREACGSHRTLGGAAQPLARHHEDRRGHDVHRHLGVPPHGERHRARERDVERERREARRGRQADEAAEDAPQGGSRRRLRRMGRSLLSRCSSHRTARAERRLRRADSARGARCGITAAARRPERGRPAQAVGGSGPCRDARRRGRSGWHDAPARRRLTSLPAGARRVVLVKRRPRTTRRRRRRRSARSCSWP